MGTYTWVLTDTLNVYNIDGIKPTASKPVKCCFYSEGYSEDTYMKRGVRDAEEAYTHEETLLLQWFIWG